MTENLEKLIVLAITDGVITDKEREILLKKAIEEGLDLDEFEMEFEAKLFERQQELKKQTASQITKPTSNKEGDLKKCPSCGAPVPSFRIKCDDCGYEFRNIESSKSIKDFFILLKDEPLVKHSSIINNFPVPNTKEDIIEFLTLAIGNCRELSQKEKQSYLDLKNVFSGGYSPELKQKEAEIRAWQSKVQSTLQKGKIMLGDTTSFEILKGFENEFNRIKKQNKRQGRSLYWILGGMFILLFVISIPMAIMESSERENKESTETKKLEKLIEDINKDVEHQNYNAALIKAAGIKWTGNDYTIEKNKWDEKRESIVEAIHEAQKNNYGQQIKN